MSRDLHLLDEETGDVYSFNNLRTSSYLRGQVVGVEAAAGYLRKKATEHFEADEVDKAVDLRKLARRLVEVLGNEHERHAQEHELAYPDVIKKGARGK